ncbi:MAG: hypothetical protein A3B30_03985 [Candidatus Komeilibacteria bacterium RIFCSPLOWO2_01_FULL_52_15]|uniref:Type II secretion system protein GspI C-terminal domain-containing protein n=2 Tax=Candidatus Komeiliibacteriota TaxID=1817908 RepID=A0A1G2BQB6_9BACT|nr:MAG: hypothetical protein A2677_00685 [Candidatus Komeilibacteria bacterium RIFCSPHIGHO2_01_FULL_52_14]OGY91323.1 MAG: hypothetical protein A3B30_03985 [Candidatus Komeilibacteria bacterium RIFCSPLOWO2_01_FULL_52_15]
MKRQDGYTIVELLVYMAISTLAIVVLTSFMVDVTKYAASTRARKDIEENARLVFSRMTQDIRSARVLNAVGAGSNELDFQNGVGAALGYRWNTGSFILEYNDGSGTWTALTTDKVRVTNLNFTNQTTGNPDEVTVDLELHQKNPSAPAGQQYGIHLVTTVIRHGSVY